MDKIRLVETSRTGVRRYCFACGLHKTATNICAACDALWDPAVDTLPYFIAKSRARYGLPAAEIIS